jgi:hypothetical protein
MLTGKLKKQDRPKVPGKNRFPFPIVDPVRTGEMDI